MCSWLLLTDTQLLAEHLLAHAAMNHSNSFAVKGEAVFLSRHSLGRKLPSDNYLDSPVLSPWVTAQGQEAIPVVRTGAIGKNNHLTSPLLISVRNEVSRTDTAKKMFG